MKRCRHIFLCLFFGYACFSQQGGMSYFAGAWELEGRTAGSEGAQPDYKATWLVEKGLDTAFCLAAHVLLNDKNFTRELITYNAVKKVYERHIWANDGSHFEFSSIGWQKNTLTWTGRQYKGAQIIDMREEIMMRSDDGFNAAFYSRQNGKWTLLTHEVLQRIR